MLNVLVCAMAQSPNLLVNPSFALGTDGWGSLWTRAEGVGIAKVVDSRSGKKAIEVRHTGEQDWAFSHSGTVTVKAGDVMSLSAWIKSENLQSAGVSVVTRTGDGKVLDWMFGEARTAGTHDWKRITRRFVVPSTCTNLQFRLAGNGPGNVWMESPTLAKVGVIGDFIAPNQKPITLRNASLSLHFDTDGSIHAEDLVAHRTWSMHGLNDGLAVASMTRISDHQASLELLNVGEERHYKVTVELDPTKPESTLSIAGQGDLPRDLAYPGSLETKAGQWLILPMNEGISYPVDDPSIATYDLITYGGHGLCMPWYGLTDPKSGAGVMGILLTPNDAAVQVRRSADGLLQEGPGWQSERSQFGYTRKLRLAFFAKGGYVAMAKRYRKHAQDTGLLVTLREKQKSCKWVDRLVGAVNVWNWDMNPVELGTQMKQAGMDHVLWSRGGTPDEIKTLNDLGFLVGRYDIYQDVWDPKVAQSWMNTAGWPQDLVWLANGDWMKGWAHPDKQKDGSVHWIQGGVICSEPGLARAKQMIPQELKDHPYHARFIDTTTASPWRECYNPAHPLTRTQDRTNKMALLQECKDLNLVVGCETGIDPSVPHLHYYEGMMSLGPYRLPDAGTDMISYRKPTPDFMKFQVGAYYRLPLWELVYHDCTVAQWYWGDATNKAPEVWTQRDLLNILYGTAPLLMFDRERWTRDKHRMVKTYHDVCDWTRKVGYDEMLSHEYLSADHQVQRTRFASGKSAIVNFSEIPWVGAGVTVQGKGFVLQGR